MKNILYLIIILLVFSCTEQKQTRLFGGTYIIDVPKGYTVNNAAWREYELWYFIEPMDSDYVPKRKIFREDSRYVLFEEQVIFQESK